MVFRNRHAKKRRRHAFEHRRRVRVCRCHGQAVASQSRAPCQPGCDLRDQFLRYAEVIRGNQNGGPLLAVIDGERLGPDRLRDAFGLGAAETEAAQPHGIGGRNVDLGNANLVGRLLRGRRQLPRTRIRRFRAEEHSEHNKAHISFHGKTNAHEHPFARKPIVEVLLKLCSAEADYKSVLYASLKRKFSLVLFCLTQSHSHAPLLFLFDAKPRACAAQALAILQTAGVPKPRSTGLRGWQATLCLSAHAC